MARFRHRLERLSCQQKRDHEMFRNDATPSLHTKSRCGHVRTVLRRPSNMIATNNKNKVAEKEIRGRTCAPLCQQTSLFSERGSQVEEVDSNGGVRAKVAIRSALSGTALNGLMSRSNNSSSSLQTALSLPAGRCSAGRDKP